MTERLAELQKQQEWFDAFPGYENNDFSITEDSEVFANGFERVPLEEIDRIVND